MLENDAKVCNCPKIKCQRYGQCEECIKHHASKGGRAYCKRSDPSRKKGSVINKLRNAVTKKGDRL